MEIGTAGGGAFNTWYFDLESSLTDGTAEADRLYGLSSHTTPVSGDWDGDGDTDMGIVFDDGGTLRWLLDTDGDPEAELNFLFGASSADPVTGDWDGNGTTNVGAVAKGGGFNNWYLDTNFSTDVNMGPFIFGLDQHTPVTGDWDGDGFTEAGAVEPEGNFLRWYLDYQFDGNAAADESFLFGRVDTADTPITGDWNDDGVTDPGVTRQVGVGLHWFRDITRDETGTADLPEILFGLSNHKPITGHWSVAESQVSDTRAGNLTSGDTLDFSFGTDPAAPEVRGITIENTGNDTLTVANLSVPSGFSTVGFPATVAPGTEVTFSLELDRSVSGLQSGSVSFTTNDHNETPFVINVNEVAPTFLTMDLAESNAAEWESFAGDGAATTVVDSTQHVTSGAESILFTTESGFDTGVAYPATADANWNLSDDHRLEFRGQAQNSNIGWQHENTYVELITAGGGRIEYRPKFPVDDGYFPKNGDFLFTMSLHGDAMWERTDFGNASLEHVNQLRLHFDTWDAGFQIHIDGVRFFNPRGYEARDAMANDDNLIRNPSFELPESGVDAPIADEFHQIVILPGGSTTIRDWVVFEGDAAGTLDWVYESILDAAHGRSSVDLNGTPGFGGIRQTVPTMPGVTYELSFELGGNPAGALLPTPDDPLKVMAVRAAGQSQTFEHALNDSPDLTDPQWRKHRWSFTATEYATDLEFVGIAPEGSLFGALIDNIHLTPSRNLVQNGGFEEFDPTDGTIADRPTADDLFLTLRNGSTAISGWEVIVNQPGDTLDWVHRANWNPSDGNFSIDLNGTAGRAGVRQTIATETGRTYDLTFDLAANPVVAGFDPVKVVQVTVNGVSQEMTYVADPNTTLREPHWHQRTVRFTATDTLTDLEFLSLAPSLDDGSDELGPIIDNVRVEAVENLLVNGSFERGRTADTTRPTPLNPAVTVGSSELAGWNVAAGSSDWFHTDSQSVTDGQLSLRLNTGWLSQPVLVPGGHRYLLTFDAVGLLSDNSVAVGLGTNTNQFHHTFEFQGSSETPHAWHHFEVVLNSLTIGDHFLNIRGLNGLVHLDNVQLVSLDYGDSLPDHPTVQAENGARHLPQGPILGGRRDSEADAEPDDGLDEDGVFVPPLPVGATTQASYVVTNPALGAWSQPWPQGNYFSGWIDFNNDGDWDDPGEEVVSTSLVRGGLNNFNITVPAGITATSAAARFRLSTVSGLGPTGYAADGEVEDYTVSLLPPAEIEGFVWNDLNGNGERDVVSIVGDDPDVVFVIDVSGSVSSGFQGTSVGDLNNHGGADTILDAEIAGFIALNQYLIDEGFGTSGEVSIVAFGDGANLLDLDPVTSGIQTTASPSADLDNDGEADVAQALRTLRHGGATNFQAALSVVASQLDAMGSTAANGNVVFVSDGFPTPAGQNYVAHLPAIRQRAANVRAFGVGGGSSLGDLRNIDSGALRFQSTDEILAAFSGLGGSTAFLEPGLAGWTVYVDENDNGVRDPNEMWQLTQSDNVATGENETGFYRFENLPAGKYVIRQERMPGWQRTFPVPPEDSHCIVTDFGDTISDVNFGNLIVVNTPPDAVDDTFSVVTNTPTELDVITNDTDADGDSLRLLTLTQPANGTVEESLPGSGVLIYTPDLNYMGGDSFAYTITDGNGGEDTAMVTLTVSGSNQVDTFIVRNTNDSGPGSLRQNILEANASPNAARIIFEIPTSDPGFVDVDSTISGGDVGADVFRIQPASTLPAIDNVNGQSITIDATSQRIHTGETSVFGPEVQLDGSLAGSGVHGFVIDSDHVELRGFAVGNFDIMGVLVRGDFVTIAGNYIGTDPTGTVVNSNRVIAGIEVFGASSTSIGGANVEDRNLISGNGGFGILAQAASDSLMISGNFIGTDRTGSLPLGNGSGGVRILASNDIAVGPSNVISGNAGTGLSIDSGSSFVAVQQNLIGTDESGIQPLANNGSGVLIHHSTNVTVNGNVVANGLGPGVATFEAADLTFTGNRIGTTVDGMAAAGNSNHGLEIRRTSNVVVGGIGVGEGNLISGNGGSGLLIFDNSQNIDVYGNTLGTDLIGAKPIANAGSGLRIDSSTNVDVGGNQPGAGNLISGNAGSGILIHNGSNQIRVAGNQIGTNAAGVLAISNSNHGVSLQDVFDVTVGGSATGTGNVISGNLGHGIGAGSSSDIVISGNHIGTTEDGLTALGNGSPTFNGDGVNSIDSHRLRIGGPTLAERNVISGNEGSGIFLQLATSSDVTIENNFLGTDATGAMSLGRQENGIRAENSQAVTARNNLISGNLSFGIGAGNIDGFYIQSNRIGTTADGTQAIRTHENGISLSGSQNVVIGGPNTADGNLISGNRAAGARLSGTFDGLSLQNNLVGTNAAGTAEIPNGWGTSLSVGGSTGVELSDNLFSGNDQEGIYFVGDLTDRGLIARNRIGVNQTGDDIIPNGRPNIHLINASNIDVIDNISVGSLASSGLIVDQSRDITARGNNLGVLADGVTAAPNDAFGLYVLRSYDLDIHDNTISGNRSTGVRVQESSFEPTLVQWSVAEGGNDHWYWLTPDRRTWDNHEALAVSLGAHLVTVNTPDENTFVAATLVSQTNNGAAWHGFNDAATEGSFVWSSGEPITFTNWGGIEPNGGTTENYGHFYTDGTWNDVPRHFQNYGIIEFETEPDSATLIAAYGKVQFTANRIGVAADGTTELPNQDGFDITDSVNVIIGGPAVGDANVIAHNLQDGVHIRREANVTVTGNSIHSNGQEGIDLAPQGRTVNDQLDADLGPNGLQNYPVIEAVAFGATTTTISGTLHSIPNSVFDIELFDNSASVPADVEGEVFLGTAAAITDDAGNGSFSLVIPTVISPSQLLTATAIDAEGNTSEFSPAFVVLPTLTLSVDATSITEDGSATATVSRSTDNSADLDVMVVVDDQTELSVPMFVTIPGGSDSAAFSVSGIDDHRVDGPVSVAVTVMADDFNPADVDLTVTDINTAAVVVTQPTTGLTEGDASEAFYTLALSSIPEAPVTIAIQPDAQVTADSAFLTFAADQTALLPQSVAVSAVDDGDVEGNHFGILQHTVSSTDGLYDAISASDVSVMIADNDVIPEPEPAQILDDSDAEFATTGRWVRINRNGFGNTFHYAVPKGGSRTARWTFDVTPGVYSVMASWRAWANRATNAPYTVLNNATLLNRLTVNQQLPADDVQVDGTWFDSLGTYAFNAGQLIVELSNENADGLVIADAIRIERISDLPAGPEVHVTVDGVSIDDNTGVIDFGDAGHGYPAERTVTVSNPGTEDLVVSSPISVPAGFAASGFVPQTLVPGASMSFTLSMDTTTLASYSGEVSFNVNDADENPFNFTVQGTVVSLEVIDDQDPLGFSTAGNWGIVNRNGYNGGFRYAAPGSGDKLAEWTFTVDPGEYRVLVNWRAWSNRATNAPFSIFDGATAVGTVAVNQQLAPNDERFDGTWFEELGSFNIIGNQLRVELSNLADGVVIADAIRIVRVDP